eukprot:COSAG01_NODE_229_length_21089_cov_575.019194_11_plen_76_part_00
MREVLTKAGAGKLRFLNVGQEAKMREVGAHDLPGQTQIHRTGMQPSAQFVAGNSLGRTCFTGEPKLRRLDIYMRV